MSSSLSVYLLDVTATRALVGSRDDQLLEVIRTQFGDSLARDDDYFSYSIKEGAPTAYEALRAVIYGGPFSDDQDHAFQYGYAYDRLCSLTGSFLDNSCFTPHRGDWLSVVDEGLTALGITAVSVAAFSYNGLPEPLPYTHTPGCGEWTPEAITQALEQFEATKRAVDESGQAPLLEPEVVEAVMQCLGWMRHAKARPGFGVIGFRS
ncbi:DUF7691 family protein [Streptomyces griseocarneus]|uniref:DUF7691 family protein n=1 Tax=Streptomyces griseocarneus TaxID=51201 RepID=UPI00167E474B|nr:hypothetical protein [Streptomyces griseocarneus]MBZ6476259.1 hypothetical protein [Streptomyces griseocarneus]GHG63036.1 hypothetical protein GCM10018779_32240 [Streptomyces griseocarneus]